MRNSLIGLTAALAPSLTGCGYNTFQTTGEQVKAGWAAVVNQYQRRAEARAKATSIQAAGPGSGAPK